MSDFIKGKVESFEGGNQHNLQRINVNQPKMGKEIGSIQVTHDAKSKVVSKVVVGDKSNARGVKKKILDFKKKKV